MRPQPNIVFRYRTRRLAAKQGLLKMKALADAGFPQAVIPPHERPFIPALRQLWIQRQRRAGAGKVARQAPHWALQRQLRIRQCGWRMWQRFVLLLIRGWESAI